MKFHHRTHLNQCRRETPIQERVKVERNHYCTGENLIVRLRNKPNEQTILDRNGQIRIRLRLLRGRHI